jgi:hypothetical protein
MVRERPELNFNFPKDKIFDLLEMKAFGPSFFLFLLIPSEGEVNDKGCYFGGKWLHRH